MNSSSPSPDQELLSRMAAGDEEAFVVLYRRYRPTVYRFALNMSNDAALAEEVAQEVFLAFMRSPGQYKPSSGSFAPFLLGIARNQVRRRMRRRFLGVRIEDCSEPASAARNALETLAHRETIEGVRNAIQVLPAAYREVVILCDLEELSYQDAARAIGCAVGTIRSRLHRGRALLAARLRGPQSAGGASKQRLGVLA